MKILKRPIIILLALFICLSSYACSNRGLKDFAEGLSHYTIDAVYNDETKTLEVAQTVDYINNYDVELENVSFHLYANAYRQGARFSPIAPSDVESAYPNGLSYGSVLLKSLKVNSSDAQINIEGQDEDILNVALPDYLMPDARVKIELNYTVTIPNVRHRLGYFDKTINLGNFYPIACVYENGSFVTDPYYYYGDPFYSEVANYKVSITAPKKFTAAMSGNAVATELGDNIKTSSNALAMRDFAIVLGEFNTLEAKQGDIKVNYYYYDDKTADKSLAAAVDSLKTFSETFGEYPYESLSVVQTAFLNGGMEYPGLVYISDRAGEGLYTEVIIHETAHQWWYAVVGNNQVAHAWLDESLAEYSTTLFYEKNPSYLVKYDARLADALGSYIYFCEHYEANLNTVMDRKISDFTTGLEYTFMTYVKGQIMYDTLRQNIGDTAFFSALKSYYADYSFKLATPDCLIAAFETASKKELLPFFNSWVHGKVMAF